MAFPKLFLAFGTSLYPAFTTVTMRLLAAAFLLLLQADTYDPGKDMVYRWYLWATVVGVVGGIVGLCVIFWQTLQVRKSADAAKASADAAEKSANAVINSERAWLLIGPLMEGWEPVESRVAPTFRWFVKNAGRTPARILETQAIFQCLERIECLPVPTNYTEPIKPNKMLLVPSDSAEFRTFLEPSYRGFTGDDVLKICQGLVVLVAYGYVKYLDVFEKIHIAKFCHYREFIPGQKKGYFAPTLEAPEDYTEQT